MINLLPYTRKEQFKLAKRNSTFLKIILTLLLISAFLGTYYVGMKMQINNIEQSSKNQIQVDNQQDQERIDQEKSVTAEAQSIQQALSSAESALSHASYFKLISSLAQSLPSGVVIKELNVSNSQLQSPIQLQVYATSNEAVTNIKQGFSQNNTVFTNVSVESVTSVEPDDSESPSKYIATAILNLSINQGALK